MKTGSGVETVVKRLYDQQKICRDLLVEPSSIYATGAATLEIGGQSYKPNGWASQQLATLTEIPSRWETTLREKNPELWAQSINWAMRALVPGTRKTMVRTVGGTVRALLSERYLRLDSLALLDGVLPLIFDAGFQVVSAEATERHTYIKAVSPRLEGEVKKGDLLRYGLSFRTSDVGAGAVSFSSFFVRLLCDNGMTGSSRFREMHKKGADKSELHDGYADLVSDETLELKTRAVISEAKDFVKFITSGDAFERELAAMRKAASDEVKCDRPDRVVEDACKVLGVTGKEIKSDILKKFLGGGEGAGLTRWGLANAFTAAAKSETLDYDTASDLERAGGRVIELSASQWERLAG